jgi:hypothetical protein
MKVNDFDAIKNFNPENGDYLVVKGKGAERHLENKHLRGSNIPFFGRILQKIFYPTFRLKNMLEFITNQELTPEDKETLNNKMTEYFKLNDDNIATQHKSRWNAISGQFAKIIHGEKLTNYKINNNWGRIDHKCELPGSILSQLPYNKNYVIISTLDWGKKPKSSWKSKETMEGLKKYLQGLDNPVVLVIFYPQASIGLRGYGEDRKLIEEKLNAMKEDGDLDGFCFLLRGGNEYNSVSTLGWDYLESANADAIDELKKSLNNRYLC